MTSEDIVKDNKVRFMCHNEEAFHQGRELYWTPGKEYIHLAGKRYCPKCTKVHHYQHDSTYAGVSKNPVMMVKRTNKSTGDWFWGCPNFPKCKYSENRPPTSEETRRRTWAWANAQGGGPHWD